MFNKLMDVHIAGFLELDLGDVWISGFGIPRLLDYRFVDSGPKRSGCGFLEYGLMDPELPDLGISDFSDVWIWGFWISRLWFRELLDLAFLHLCIWHVCMFHL